MLSRSVLFVLAVCAPLAASAPAGTYVVDANGGGQFTDIQPAIAFAAPGDVLLVHAGSYSGFTLDKGLVIIGYGLAYVNGAVHVVNIPAGQRAALVRIAHDFYPLDVSGCAGPVFVEGDDLQRSWIAISSSNDVRLSRCDLNGDESHAALTLQGARVEIVDSVLVGGTGAQAGSAGHPNTGGAGTPALDASAGARVQFARSTEIGGAGGEAIAAPQRGGDGAPALLLALPAQVYLVGPVLVDPILGPTGRVEGGWGGYASYTGNCNNDGGGACAVFGTGVVQESGVEIHGAYTDQSIHCTSGFTMPAFCGPTDAPITPVEPSLQLAGTPSAGATITFRVYGEPGASVVLNLGRNMILVPTAGMDIERLAPANRVIPLGTIPSGGSIARSVTLPAGYAPGLLFVAQAEVTGSTGSRRTNSTPIVVR